MYENLVLSLVLPESDLQGSSRRYGSSANLVFSTGRGVNGYTLDPALGEFILTHPDVRIPSSVTLPPLQNKKKKLTLPWI